MRGKRRGFVDPSGADGPLFAALDAPREVSVGWAPRTSPEGRVPPGLRVVRPRFPGGGLVPGDSFLLPLPDRWPRRPRRPVLKHGPRSLACVRVRGCQTRQAQGNRAVPILLGRSIGRWGWPRPPPSALQHARWDPKDGELCLSRAKPEETLVEARRCADVQIAFQTRV